MWKTAICLVGVSAIGLGSSGGDVVIPEWYYRCLSGRVIVVRASLLDDDARSGPSAKVVVRDRDGEVIDELTQEFVSRRIMIAEVLFVSERYKELAARMQDSREEVGIYCRIVRSSDGDEFVMTPPKDDTYVLSISDFAGGDSLVFQCVLEEGELPRAKRLFGHLKRVSATTPKVPAYNELE